METNITEGLTISILGLLITFTSLGVFILIMFVLKKVFPYKPKEGEEEGEGEDGAEGETPSAESEEGGEEAETVAAIAAAIAFLRANSQGSVGSNLEAGRGSWWLANRMAARQSSNLLKK